MLVSQLGKREARLCPDISTAAKEGLFETGKNCTCMQQRGGRG